MENNKRSLRKRKSDENNLDLDRDVKKLYNPRQQKVRKQELKDESKEEGKLNAKTPIKDGLTKGTCNPNEQPEKNQGMVEDVGRVTREKKKRTDSGKSKTPNQMRAPIRAKGKESKEKTHYLQEKTSHKDILKRKVEASKTRQQFKNNTGGITNEIKDLECLKNKNVNLQKEIKTLQAEKCKLNIELNRSKGDANKWKENALAEKEDNKRLKEERAAMEKKTDKLGYDLQVKSNKKHDLEAQRTQLKEEIRISRKCKDDLEALQSQNDEMHKQLNYKDVELVTQVETFQNNISKKRLETAQELKELSNKLIKMKDDALKRENKLKTELAESEKHLNTERENCCQLITEKKILSQTSKEFETELFNVKKENEKSNKQIDNLERQLRDVSSENKMLKSNSVHNERVSETKKATIENEMADLQRDKTFLQKKISVLNDKIQELQETIATETKLHETKILDLKRQLKLVQDDKSETKKILNCQRQDHEKLQQMYDTIKQKIDQFKAIKTVQIQLFHGSKIPLISKVENELTAYLKKEMENEVTKLEFVECESDTDVDPDKTLLIVCINASRLGTDALTAIKTLNVTSKMALLVFHHKDGHALPSQSSEHVLTGHEFKRLGGIFDFGFLSSKGIYSCEMNVQSLKYLVNFLNKWCS